MYAQEVPVPQLPASQKLSHSLVSHFCHVCRLLLDHAWVPLLPPLGLIGRLPVFGIKVSTRKLLDPCGLRINLEQGIRNHCFNIWHLGLQELMYLPTGWTFEHWIHCLSGGDWHWHCSCCPPQFRLGTCVSICASLWCLGFWFWQRLDEVLIAKGKDLNPPVIRRLLQPHISEDGPHVGCRLQHILLLEVPDVPLVQVQRPHWPCQAIAIRRNEQHCCLKRLIQLSDHVNATTLPVTSWVSRKSDPVGQYILCTLGKQHLFQTRNVFKCLMFLANMLCTELYRYLLKGSIQDPFSKSLNVPRNTISFVNICK